MEKVKRKCFLRTKTSKKKILICFCLVEKMCLFISLYLFLRQLLSEKQNFHPGGPTTRRPFKLSMMDIWSPKRGWLSLSKMSPREKIFFVANGFWMTHKRGEDGKILKFKARF